ncbi:hypothetical protein [Lactiplantibacillus plantarum]|uniref:hypothetical protein n=1 Tax=Lactiplantibacillus plantarum TaxID=1590 RepID=UPI00214AF4E8|nr:hypothetical protein [Lactiplantibacillus plantarum]
MTFRTKKLLICWPHFSEKQLKKAPITDQEFEKVVAVAKPDVQGIHSVCQQLVISFIAEERFLAVFGDGTCHPSN